MGEKIARGKQSLTLLLHFLFTSPLGIIGFTKCVDFFLKVILIVSSCGQEESAAEQLKGKCN